VEDVFSQEDIVSWVINLKGHLLVCFEESCVKGIGVHPLFLMASRELGNVIFGIQKLYHNHIIQVLIEQRGPIERLCGLFHPVERAGYK
jgi:hypothetical protein